MKMEEYLDKLTGQIRCRLARDPIREELQMHIEDQKNAYLEEGMTETEAEEAAVLEMGDPVKTGEKFDQIHRPRMPWKTIVLIILISLLGLWTQYLVMGSESVYVDFRKQFILLVISFGVMIAVCFVDYSRIVSESHRIYILLYFTMPLLADTFGVSVNDSVKWIYIAKLGLHIDQTLLALLFVPVFAAQLCSIRGEGYLGLAGVTALVAMESFRVFGYSCVPVFLILMITYGFLLTLTVGKGWYRVKKGWVLTFFWGVIAVLAGLAGKKLVLGEETYSHSDYILAFIIRNYGIASGVVVIALMFVLIGLLLKKAFAQKNESGMLISVSCGLVFLAQAVLYLMSNFGIISAEVYFPFLTYGGSGMIVTFVLLGLLLSVFRYENVMSLYRKKNPRDYRKERIKALSEEDKPFWEKNAEQIRIFLIVFVLFVILLNRGN